MPRQTAAVIASVRWRCRTRDLLPTPRWFLRVWGYDRHGHFRAYQLRQWIQVRVYD